MRDKSEEERIVLTEKMVKLEWLEDDFLSLKRRHEGAMMDFQSEFHYLTTNIYEILCNFPDINCSRYEDLQKNQELNQRTEAYVNDQLDDLDHKTRRFRFILDDEREALMRERNQLPWE